jgi:hypothetical protein
MAVTCTFMAVGRCLPLICVTMYIIAEVGRTRIDGDRQAATCIGIRALGVAPGGATTIVGVSVYIIAEVGRTRIDG